MHSSLRCWRLRWRYPSELLVFGCALLVVLRLLAQVLFASLPRTPPLRALLPLMLFQVELLFVRLTPRAFARCGVSRAGFWVCSVRNGPRMWRPLDGEESARIPSRNLPGIMLSRDEGGVALTVEVREKMPHSRPILNISEKEKAKHMHASP